MCPNLQKKVLGLTWGHTGVLLQLRLIGPEQDVADVQEAHCCCEFVREHDPIAAVSTTSLRLRQ